jgi:hypothetical protein
VLRISPRLFALEEGKLSPENEEEILEKCDALLLKMLDFSGNKISGQLYIPTDDIPFFLYYFNIFYSLFQQNRLKGQFTKKLAR